MRLLVAIPQHTTLPPVLRTRMELLASALTLDNAGLDWTLDVAIYPNAEHPVAGDLPCAPHARARNALLDRYLRPDHDAVLWLDADLTYYPPLLPRLLAAVQPPGGIVAPLVLIEGTTRLYDTQGVRTVDGGPVAREAPYFVDCPQLGPRLYQLGSVGCAYLAPAALYHAGVRYAPTAGHTEHWSVMAAHRDRGGAVACTTALTAYHANLPDYGEAWHPVVPRIREAVG